MKGEVSTICNFHEQRIWLWNEGKITSVDHQCRQFVYLSFIFLVSFFELNCLLDVSSTQHYLPIGKLWTCTYINAINVNVYSLRSESQGRKNLKHNGATSCTSHCPFHSSFHHQALQSIFLSSDANILRQMNSLILGFY